MSAAIHEDADLSDAEVRSRAATAAMQASSGLASLCMVAADGAQADRLWSEEETVELLLDAAKMALELERDFVGGIAADRAELLARITEYLEGWV